MNETKKPTGKALRRYIAEHIDQAIEDGWICAYYQPVVRTITGEICGMEALARWNDPTYGLLAPDEFIGALEKERLIHKLDSHIIHLICRDYADRMKTEEPPVTISFNLSRLDFQLCDIHNIIEHEIRSFRVPREALRVEITESMMENDSERMHDVIDRFWDRGFRVWMDDFGSGYSSLNVLKDYHFDTLKIDMVFLRNFDAKSREIVKSVVGMSKHIGVHTLAEGVETVEQLEFLRSIGCEKAQGYYIGKPLPYAECRDSLTERGYRFEAIAKRQYYHDIGRVNPMSATPLSDEANDNEVSSEGENQLPIAIVEYSEGKLSYLFTNENYLKTIVSLGIPSTEAVEKEFSDPSTLLHEKFLSMIERARQSNDNITADFVRNNHYCFCQVRRVASFPGGTAFLCVLQNLSEDFLLSKGNDLTEHLHNLCSVYERITLIDTRDGSSEDLYQSGGELSSYDGHSAEEDRMRVANEEIYPEDKERYLRFTELSTIEKRIAESPARYITSPYRRRTHGGTFAWGLHSFLLAGDKGEGKVLSCFRRLPPDTIARLYGDPTNYTRTEVLKDSGKEITPETLWKNFCYNSDTGFFWKDKNRRFLGVNRKFLEYYGLESESAVIGKTDEDMGWHVDPLPFKLDEERILRSGEQTFLLPGTCICKGEIRNILASKFPLYLDGEIVGLMGYFLDVTEWKEQGLETDQLSLSDSLTGSLNFLGLVESTLKYQDSYAFHGTDFAMLLFDIDHFHLFNESFGIEWSNLLLIEVARRIREIVGVEAIAGRFNSDRFLVVKQFEDGKEIEALSDEIVKKVEAIREINGIPCTIYLKTRAVRYSETRDMVKMFSTVTGRLS